MDTETSKWLEGMAQILSRESVDPYRRPWEALRRYSIEKNVDVNFSSAFAHEVFDWFQTRSRPGEHAIGALYTSVYFYDSTYWKVEIPLGYGRFVLDAGSCLKDMPQSLKTRLLQNPNSGFDYALWWADCADYAFGISEVDNPERDRFGLSLLYAADQELRGAITLLLETRVNARAILALRMAVEMFLKSILAFKTGLTDAQAKKLGHDLHSAFEKFVSLEGYGIWKGAVSLLDLFPPVNERYQRQVSDKLTLWKVAGLAQSLGTVIVREYTGRNTADAVLKQFKGR